MGFVPQKTHAFIDLLRINAEELGEPLTMLKVQDDTAALPVAEGSRVSANGGCGCTNTKAERSTARAEMLAEVGGRWPRVIAQKLENRSVCCGGRLPASFLPVQQRSLINAKRFGSLALIETEGHSARLEMLSDILRRCLNYHGL